MKKSRFFLDRVSLILLIAPGFVFAQAAPSLPEAANSSDGLQEIIVTARKREESLQDVPGTVTAVSGDELDLRGLRSVTDLQQTVSGVIIQSDGNTFPLISMRGTANRIGAQTTVGLYEDGIYLDPSQITTGNYDAARTEVVKGPQDTLYGRATLAGAINIVTNDPTDQLTGGAEVGAGSSASDRESLYHVQGIISGPLVGDSLLGRLVLVKDYREGYVYDPFSGARGAGYDRDFLRAKFLWRVSDTFDIKTTAELLNDRPTSGLTYDAAVSGGSFIPFLDTRPGVFAAPIFTASNIWERRYDQQTYGQTSDRSFSVEMNWQSPIGTVTSLSNYSRAKLVSNQDVDGTQYPIAFIEYADDLKHYSEELRLAGGDRLKYLAGLYYIHIDSNGPPGAAADLTFGPGSTEYDAVGLSNEIATHVSTTANYAGFAQLGYDFTDQLNITAGTRWSRDSFSAFSTEDLVFANGASLEEFGPNPIHATAAFDAVTYNAVASYKLVPGVLAYASYARGNEPGGLNQGPTAAAAQTPYLPENVNAYEVGLKGTFFDSRLRANVALFYDRYGNLQFSRTEVIADGSLQNIIANAANSLAQGVDLDLTYLLTKHLRASLLYTNLSAKITQFTLASGTPTASDLTGQPVTHSPRNSGSFGLDWYNDFSQGRLSLGANLYFTSQYANDYQTPPVYGEPVDLGWTKAYHTINLTAAYTASDKWQISAYVRNLANVQYYQVGFLDFYGQELSGIPGEPRTYEVTLKKSF
jgi:iron complex outermembrane recepter protein